MRKRNNQINIRLYDSELEKLNKKVAKSGLTRETFIRNVLSGTDIKPAPPVEFADLIKEIRRIGNNLNQLVHYANGNGYVDKDRLSESLAELDKLESELWSVFKTGGK